MKLTDNLFSFITKLVVYSIFLFPVMVFAQLKPTIINPVLTAVGVDNSTGKSLPLLAVSTDGSASWAVKSIPNLPDFSAGLFYASSCTGDGATAVCTAAGGGTTSDTSLIPLLSMSTNGGIDWTVPSIPNLPKEGRFIATSCAGNDPAVCTAVGDAGSYPLLAVSTNSGKSWEIKSIPDLGNGLFQATSCTGSGSTGICIAAGSNTTNRNQPMVAVSENNGETWAMKPIPGLSGWLRFNAASCTGSGSTAICTIAGEAINDQTPLLLVSTDGGRNWSLKLITGLPPMPNNNFLTTSCTGSGPTAVCIAAGMSGNRAPLLAVSTDGGTSWAAQSIPNFSYGELVSTSCTGTGSTAICTATGPDHFAHAPLIVVSRDGGKDWSVPPITGFPIPTDVIFNATKCTGSGSTAICTAAGRSGPYPLLAASIDGGMNWSVQSVQGIPNNGAFNGSGATATENNMNYHRNGH